MANKHKAKEKRQSVRQRRRQRRGWWLALAAALVLAVAGYYLSGGGSDGTSRSFSVKGGETRPVLDPFLFPSPQVQMAYTVARNFRETLDQVYCYCRCDRPPFNHKSLLSCFTDAHGST